MIVHTGGLASGFKNKNDVSSKDDDGTALFHVRGTTDLNTCGVQVEETSELNGEDCFVLVTPSNTFVWSGNAANADEIATAKNIGQKLCDGYLGTGGRALSEIKEGGEPDAFWQALGGKADYPAYAPGEAPPRAPRLFEVSNQTGVIRMEEVCSFTQMDLSNDDTYLLDCYNKVFVWIGTGANATERAAASELSQKFVSEANDGRDPDSPVISVNAGAEPSSFTCWFQGWDNDYFNSLQFKDPYAAKLAQAKAQQQEAAPQRMTASRRLRPRARVSTSAAPQLPLCACRRSSSRPCWLRHPCPWKVPSRSCGEWRPLEWSLTAGEVAVRCRVRERLKMSRADFDKLPA